jgi:hypothetical protein
MSDGIPFIPTVPPGLREAAQRGTLIPFVGAGRDDPNEFTAVNLNR